MPKTDTTSPVEAVTTRLGREEVRDLLEHRSGPCVSIFLPTVQAGAETLQNPIRLKNLLRAAEELLAERGTRRTELDELLEPLRALVGDGEFWQHQSAGLALFRAPDLLRGYRLPLPFAELAVVEDRFYLKPLFPLLDGDGRFYVLALSMSDVRLLEGTRGSVREVDLGPRVPRSVTEAVGEAFGQKPLLFAASGPARRREGAPVFHGHGVTEDDTKVEIEKFLHRVESGLMDLPIDHQAPLVLAGVDYLLPLYRAVSEHPNVVPEAILGNPEEQRAEELHAAAWKLVEPLFLESRRREADRYRALASKGRAGSRLAEVLGGAHDGRVEALFVARGERRWGSWDAQDRKVVLHGEQSPGNEDLLDLAAVQTFLHRGEVFAVPPEEVPEPGEPLAAIFRW